MKYDCMLGNVLSTDLEIRSHECDNTGKQIQQDKNTQHKYWTKTKTCLQFMSRWKRCNELYEIRDFIMTNL